MKPFHSLPRIAVMAAVGAAFWAALPEAAKAQEPWDRRGHDFDRWDDEDGDHWVLDDDHWVSWDRDGARRAFFAVPRSRFVITYGDGYAGRGYYYGPPAAPYFYEAPGVRFYRSRTLVPSSYWGPRPVMGREASEATDRRVQIELKRLGYYAGAIDGIIGTGSRNAIMRFQRDRGLPITGRIDEPLVSALGIY